MAWALLRTTHKQQTFDKRDLSLYCKDRPYNKENKMGLLDGGTRKRRNISTGLFSQPRLAEYDRLRARQRTPSQYLTPHSDDGDFSAYGLLKKFFGY
jgi:hypothetical protein